MQLPIDIKIIHLNFWHIYICTFRCWCVHTYNLIVAQVALILSNLPSNAEVIGDASLIHGLRRSPGTNHGNPFLFLCVENPMDREHTKDDRLCDAECQKTVYWLNIYSTRVPFVYCQRHAQQKIQFYGLIYIQWDNQFNLFFFFYESIGVFLFVCFFPQFLKLFYSLCYSSNLTALHSLRHFWKKCMS